MNTRTVTLHLTEEQFGALAHAVALAETDYEMRLEEDDDPQTRAEAERLLDTNAEARALETCWADLKKAWYANGR